MTTGGGGGSCILRNSTHRISHESGIFPDSPYFARLLGQDASIFAFAVVQVALRVGGGSPGIHVAPKLGILIVISCFSIVVHFSRARIAPQNCL
jgi:hypothetical protein